MSEESLKAVRAEVEAALVALDATASAPLAERAEAFEAFHASLAQILDAEPAQ